MSEVMSAEKLVENIRRVDSSGTYIIPDWYDAEMLVKSRDAAIIEKCKKAVIESNCHEDTFNSGDIDRILFALDSVLSEIEEDK